MKDLERENATLKRLLVDAELEEVALKETVAADSRNQVRVDLPTA